MFTKQFAILTILVTVFLFAISLVASLAIREATTTYDLYGIFDGLYAITDLAHHKIVHQEEAMHYWTYEATNEVWGAFYNTQAFCDYAHSVIGPSAVPAP